jgi:hypothetical protein
MTTTITSSSRSTALVAARLTAGLLGSVQLAGAVFFLLLAPEEAVWVGPWLDVPVVALTLSGICLKLVVAFLPRLHAVRRIAMGFLAVAIGATLTLVKVPVYDEPEGLIFLVFDVVLLLLLLLARRSTRR